MNSVCSATATVTSETEVKKPYTSSILPASQQERSSSDGRLTQNAMEGLYLKLVTSGKFVSNDRYKQLLVSVTTQKDKAKQQSILETVGEQEKQTMLAIQTEFCYYYVRYKYALDDLFETLSRISATSGLTDAERKTIESKISTAKDLNIKLNDLIQFTNYIAKKRASEMRDQNLNINMMNESIKDIYGRLQNQNNILQREDSITDLRRRMVEFTQEKNQSASNLLSLYGFLNLVALGLLFYVARS